MLAGLKANAHNVLYYTNACTTACMYDAHCVFYTEHSHFMISAPDCTLHTAIDQLQVSYIRNVAS